MSQKINYGDVTPVQQRKSTHVLLIFLLLFLVALEGIGVCETRQHESHVHGAAELNIALDGTKLFLELSSPAANIVGFEHAPNNEEQRETVHKAMEQLKKGEKLFVLPAKAKCRLQEAHIENVMKEEHHDKHEDEDHDEEEKHSDKEHDDGAEHSDIEVTYHFECTHPEHLKTIDVLLFKRFSGVEEIEVQLITTTKQTALELTPKKHLLSF